MKKLIYARAGTLVFASALLVPAFVVAATKTLNLVVEGSIEAPPEWRSDRNLPITQLALSFAGTIAGSDPNLDVDSTVALARLITSSYPATVAMARPQGCAIGANKVDNAHVFFVMNGTVIKANGTISIPSAASQNYQLRFSSAGKHGTQNGAVSCSSSGVLTYTY